jgi:hypothetical protein
LLNETLLQLENPVAKVLKELFERKLNPDRTDAVSSSPKSPCDTEGGAVIIS